LVLEPGYFPSMARRGGCGERHATIGYVYERDEHLEARLVKN